MKLSPNFSLKELIQSQTATRKGINNNPNEDQISKMEDLCKEILQPVRDHFGKVVSVSSGFRCEELCLAIGSSVNSQHAKGEAADFEIFGVSNKELADWIYHILPFDQLILEYWNPDEANSGWVHCSYKPDGRKQYLKAARDSNGKTYYDKCYPANGPTKDEINASLGDRD